MSFRAVNQAREYFDIQDTLMHVSISPSVSPFNKFAHHRKNKTKQNFAEYPPMARDMNVE